MKIQFSFFLLSILLISVSSFSQYYLSDPEYSEDGRVFIGILNFKGEFNPDDYKFDWSTNKTKEILIPIEKLNIRISLECNEYLHIYVTDAMHARWENPFSISDSYKQKIQNCTQTKSLKDFGLSISEEVSEPFYLSLTNPETNELIFTTKNSDFIYSDFFIGFGGYASQMIYMVSVSVFMI